MSLRSSSWSLTKGHLDAGETDFEAALMLERDKGGGWTRGRNADCLREHHNKNQILHL